MIFLARTNARATGTVGVRFGALPLSISSIKVVCVSGLVRLKLYVQLD